LRRLRISSRQRHPAGHLAVQTDLERILAGTREGNVEHQYCTCFHVYHTRRWFPELHCALAAQELTAAFIHEANPDGVNSDFGSAAADP
jgi:hypothetical protein